MMIHFYNAEHKRLYELYIRKARIDEDLERLSCFYLLALIGATKQTSYNFNVENYYNFHKNEIISDSLNRAELTGTTTRIVKLAYILFNDCPSIEPEHRSINQIFGYSEKYDPYMLEAIKIRYRIEEPEQDTRESGTE